MAEIINMSEVMRFYGLPINEQAAILIQTRQADFEAGLKAAYNLTHHIDTYEDGTILPYISPEFQDLMQTGDLEGQHAFHCGYHMALRDPIGLIEDEGENS